MTVRSASSESNLACHRTSAASRFSASSGEPASEDRKRRRPLWRIACDSEYESIRVCRAMPSHIG